MLMQPSLDFTPNKDTTLSSFGSLLQKMWRNISLVVNGLINFGDGTNKNNIDGVWANLTAPAAPNTDFTVTHNLGRIPAGYWLMEKDRAVDVYTGSVGATSSQITLRATVASAVIRLFIVCLFLFCGSLTQAQTTSVTLQVTDAGSQTWNNGTWTAVLSSLPGASNYGPPFNIINNGGTVPNQTQTGSLSVTGGASLTATPNSVVTPANSQWKFTVCPQASPVQCYVQFVTVTNTGTQTVTLAPPTIVINLGQTTTNALAYATTEIGSAIIGSQFYLIGTGLQICSVVSGSSCVTWSGAGGGGGAFSSITSGTNTTAAMVCGTGCSISTSGSGTVTSTNGISGITTGFIPKAASATSLANSLCDEAVTTANTVTCGDTSGLTAPSLQTNTLTAGFVDYVQGGTSAAQTGCAAGNSICEQAPSTVSYYLLNKPPAAAQGTVTNINTSNVITQGFSGDVNHSANVSWSSATSIGSTVLCSTTNCPVGTYRVTVYIDVTTACTTTGAYLINLIYTDDTNVSKTTPVFINGTGVTFATGTLVPISTTDYGYAVAGLRSTGAVSINYSTTATACATGGPAVGKFYLVLEPVQ
jgi:hypothetical protein